jgi:hypothetical protein
MITENKAYFLNILNTKQKERYGEFSKATGLAWHPSTNGVGTEKIYIEFLDTFLTDYYQEAKIKGDDALLGYFKAFEGICFEDRARSLEEYAASHPLAKDAADVTEIAKIPDWSESDKVEDVWMKETVWLRDKLKKIPTPAELLKHLQTKMIFDKEFKTEEESKAKLTEEQFKIWAKEQVEMFILEEDELDQGDVPQSSSKL